MLAEKPFGQIESDDVAMKVIADAKAALVQLGDALRKQAYDPEQVKDKLYVMKPGAAVYEALSAEFAQQIKAGNGGY